MMMARGNDVSPALFGVRGSSGVNSGALCSTIACKCSVSLSLFLARFRSFGRSVGRYRMDTPERAGGRKRWSFGVNVDAPLVLGQAPPNFHNVARQLRISAQTIFFQRKEGVGLGKGARACGKRSVSDTREKKRYIDFGEVVGYYVE